MKVAHIGPPLGRQGGPAGYLLQLYRAAQEAGALGRIAFSAMAPARAARRSTLAQRVRSGAGRIKRRIVGPPRQYRPNDDRLTVDRGPIDTQVRAARDAMIADAAPSLAAAASAADVLFCHDPATADHALGLRRPDQQVWLMVHSPMPLGLYLAWNWGVPERDWREVMAFPDVQRWCGWEIDIWRAVDRLVLPCPEALDEVVRIAPAAGAVETPISWILSGASADSPPHGRGREAPGRAWQLPDGVPVVLFLGNHLPYRGLDALIGAARSLDSNAPPGLVAVAGPPRQSVPRHPRVRALGHVADVAGLMAAVDCVINVNRFSLFDLSTIEALEAGRPLLLHAVGGNRTFQELGAGVDMLADLQASTIAAGLARVFAMSDSDRQERSDASRRCYASHLTRAHMWARHAELYRSATARAAVPTSV